MQQIDQDDSGNLIKIAKTELEASICKDYPSGSSMIAINFTFIAILLIFNGFYQKYFWILNTLNTKLNYEIIILCIYSKVSNNKIIGKIQRRIS